MAHRPPKGVRPHQLEGKRTGRPRGSKSHAGVWADILWAYHHRHEDRAAPPTEAARLWWTFAARIPDEFEEWLLDCGKV